MSESSGTPIKTHKRKISCPSIAGLASTVASTLGAVSDLQHLRLDAPWSNPSFAQEKPTQSSHLGPAAERFELWDRRSEKQNQKGFPVKGQSNASRGKARRPFAVSRIDGFGCRVMHAMCKRMALYLRLSPSSTHREKRVLR